MENLNAEKVKEWLEICAEDTPYPDQSQALLDALALINSQEQRIKELTEENERLRAEVSVKKKLLDKCVDLEDKVKACTVKKMQEMVYEFADDLNTIDAYIIKEMIDQIAKVLIGE
jgi:uncharacterized small protein (DUF1192 family)